MLALVILAIVTVFAFDFFNGFHDAANAIATVVATKVLTPMRAVAMAAVGNFVGMVFVTNAIAETIGQGIIDTTVFVPHAPPLSDSEFLHAMAIILAGVVGAIVWDLLTWWWGLPTSSSHALIGGLVGSTLVAGAGGSILMPPAADMAAFAGFTGLAFLFGVGLYAAASVVWKERPKSGSLILAGLLASLLPMMLLGRVYLKGIVQVVVYMIAAPVVGLTFAFLFTLIIMRLGRRTSPTKINREFRRLQLLSSFFYSVTHGTNDAQKGMGIITLILIVAAIQPWNPVTREFHVPLWVILGAHASISFGTFFGGWRIVRTMAKRVTQLRPYQGFCAETGGGLALAGTALAGIPVSTTHVISSAIMGVGATRRLSAVRWGVARRIVWAWVLTIPASAVIGAVAFAIVHTVFGI